jgi:hypothetical protein
MTLDRLLSEAKRIGAVVWLRSNPERFEVTHGRKVVARGNTPAEAVRDLMGETEGECA